MYLILISKDPHGQRSSAFYKHLRMLTGEINYTMFITENMLDQKKQAIFLFCKVGKNNYNSYQVFTM